MNYNFLYDDMSSINWVEVLKPTFVKEGCQTTKDKITSHGEHIVTSFNENGFPLMSTTTYQLCTDVSIIDTWEYNDNKCVHKHEHRGRCDNWTEEYDINDHGDNMVKRDGLDRIVEDSTQTYEYDDYDRIIKIYSKLHSVYWKCNWDGDDLNRIDIYEHADENPYLSYSIYIKYIDHKVISIQYYRKDDNGMGILDYFYTVEYTKSGMVDRIEASYDDGSTSYTSFIYDSSETLLIGEVTDGSFTERSISTYRHTNTDDE